MVVTVSHVSVLDVCSLVFWFLCYTHTCISLAISTSEKPWSSHCMLPDDTVSTTCYMALASANCVNSRLSISNRFNFVLDYWIHWIFIKHLCQGLVGALIAHDAERLYNFTQNVLHYF